MPVNYDQAVFEEIYKKTQQLRNKLVYGIDHRRYGVDRQEVLSWFDVKFIFAFTKYYNIYGPDTELLKAHIIKALQFFKNRVLRFSYSQKNLINLNAIDIEETYDAKETRIEWQPDDTPVYLNLATSFLKEQLSPEAYKFLLIELDPPTYILKRLSEKEQTTKIPGNLITEYLGLDEDELPRIKKEIRNGIDLASSHFQNVSLSI